MGEVINFHNSENTLNLEAYFTESGAYIEEYDTPDGRHWISGCKPEDYPPNVREKALKLGVIDIRGKVIPWDGTFVTELNEKLQ